MSDDLTRAPHPTAVMLTERTRFGGETGAGILRNRCAFTSRDMGADWPEAFVYAVVFGWDESIAHTRFEALADKTEDARS